MGFPANTYMIAPQNNAGQQGNTGLQIVFAASSLANAQTVAQSFSTMFAIKVTLTDLNAVGTAPALFNIYTYSPAAQGGTVSVPNGTSA